MSFYSILNITYLSSNYKKIETFVDLNKFRKLKKKPIKINITSVDQRKTDEKLLLVKRERMEVETLRGCLFYLFITFFTGFWDI
jgi:hypothetical protein